MLLFTKSCAWSKSAGRCIWNRNASYRTRLWNRNDSYRTRLDFRPSTVGVNRCEFKFEVDWCLVPGGKLFSYKKFRFRKSDVHCAQARFFARHDCRDFSKLLFVSSRVQKICQDFSTTHLPWKIWISRTLGQIGIPGTKRLNRSSSPQDQRLRMSGFENETIK